MNNQQYAKILLMVYILINICDNKYLPNTEIRYQINSNSIEYIGGLLRVIGSNEDNVHIGANSMIFQIPYDLNHEIETLINWKHNISTSQYKNASTGSIFLQFMSQFDNSQSSIEVCGSDGYNLECRTYDFIKKMFTSRHKGFRMIPSNIRLATKQIPIGQHIVVAVPAENNDAYIALHFNRSIYHRLTKPMVTSPLSFHYDHVNFLLLTKFRDKIYFIFTESASEFINYYNIFLTTNKPRVIFTRLGRFCQNDSGAQFADLFFTTFMKTTLTCQLWLIKTKFTKKYIDYTHAISALEIDGESGKFLILFRSSQPTNFKNKYSSVICQFNFKNIEKQMENSRVAILENSNFKYYWKLNRKTHNLSNCKESLRYFTPNTEWMVSNRLKPVESPLLIKTNESIGNPTTFQIIRSLPLTITTKRNKSFVLNIDIILIGTDKGVVAKSVKLNKESIEKLKKHKLSELFVNESILRFDHTVNVFNEHVSINDIKINIKTKSIIVTSSSLVKRIPLEFCSKDCWSCNRNLDPMCQWNTKTNLCEIKQLNRRMNNIQLYDCQTEKPFRSRNMLQEKHVDYFWLIFSIVTFFSVFAVVLTVSIALRYSPVSFPRTSRNTSSTIYQIIHNKDLDKSNKKQRTIRSSVTSSLSDSNSIRPQRFKLILPNKSFKTFNSTKESLIFENKFNHHNQPKQKQNIKSKAFSFKATKKIKAHFYNNSINDIRMNSWKSCDAIFQFTTK